MTAPVCGKCGKPESFDIHNEERSSISHPFTPAPPPPEERHRPAAAVEPISGVCGCIMSICRKCCPNTYDERIRKQAERITLHVFMGVPFTPATGCTGDERCPEAKHHVEYVPARTLKDIYDWIENYLGTDVSDAYAKEFGVKP